jgi:putative oxygen-independent coproporphyrinogen III oxidase
MSLPSIVPATSAGSKVASLPPLSLYVHLPWCVRKCPYCDFNSYEHRGELPEREYVAAVRRDLRSELPLVQGRRVGSVFLGGGTPSLFSGDAIAELLEAVASDLELTADAEITLEANPGAVDATRFAAFRSAGVNRLSIGVQSFRDGQLRALGRVHDSAEARRAIALARAAGFDNLNLDLMYGLPGDDIGGALDDLEQALEIAPAHLSWYQLTLEPNTAFERRPPQLPSEDVVIEIEARGRRLLATAGYGRYEVSAYALPTCQCAHNLNYWQFGDYLGVGAGAHGKVTLGAAPAIERRAKTRNPRTYVATAGTRAAVSVEPMSEPRGVAIEFLLNALRLIDGVPESWVVTRAGQALEGIEVARRKAVEYGWLADDPGRLRPTPLGLTLLNRLLELFV